MKRVFLFIATNLAIMLVLGVVVNVLGVDRYLTANGLDLMSLLACAGIMGFGGSFLSLAFSKVVAKASTGAHVIEHPQTADEQWLVATVGKISRAANLPMPEVAIYAGSANAFATGPSRSNALVAVSTGLMQSMTREEIEAVLAHEVAHIKNGDMVTMTLIQGVVNTFVFFLARVVGYFIDQATRKHSEENETAHSGGFGYMITVFVCELVFGLAASLIVMAFSRRREYSADNGAAQLLGSPRPMIAALQRLGTLNAGGLPQNMAAFGIAEDNKFLSLFSSHPPLADRIRVLQNWRLGEER